MLVATHKYLVPIETLPASVTNLSEQVRDTNKEISAIKHTQIVQTEALKILADVASDTDVLRRDVDRHSHEIETVKKRLDKIE